MFWVRLFEVLFLLVIPVIQKILSFLGIGVISYMGINFVLNQLIDLLKSNLKGMPANMLSILGIMHLDIGLNLYFSACLAALVLKGLNKATDRKKSYVFKA